MSGPFLLLMLILLLTGVLIRSHGMVRRSAGIAVLGTLVIGVLVFLMPVGSPLQVGSLSLKIGAEWVIAGRALRLSPAAKPLIGFLFVSAAFLFGGSWAATPGRYLYSAGVLMLGLVCAAIMVQPFIFAAVFLELAALLAILILSPPGRPGQVASVRLLSFTSISMFTILLTGWMLDAVGVTEATPVLVEQVLVLLGVGFAVLLVIPPFHSWLPKATDEADVFAALFVLTVWNSAGMLFLLRFLDSYDWLRESTALYQGLFWGGIVTVVFAALWALGQKDLRQAGIYLALSDMGVGLLALSLGTANGYQLALGLLASRVLALGLWGLGVASLLDGVPASPPDSLRGLGRVRPWAGTGVFAGFLTTIGLPVSAGFPGRWGTMTGLAQSQPWAVLVVCGASLTGLFVVMRWVSTVFGPAPEDGEPSGVLAVILLGVGIALAIVLGVFPQAMFPWIKGMAGGFPALVP